MFFRNFFRGQGAGKQTVRRGNKNRNRETRKAHFRDGLIRNLQHEFLEQRLLLAADPTLPDLVFEGTEGADTFLVRLQPGDSSMLEVQVDGATSAFPLAEVESLTINGLGGDDRLTLDFSQGFVNLSTEIVYNGGSGANVLALTGGGSVARETYLLSFAQDVGRWIVDPNGSDGPGAPGSGRDGDEVLVGFSGVDTIESDLSTGVLDLIMSSGLFSTGTNRGTLEDGGSLNGATALQLTDNHNTAPTFRFANKASARIMGNSGTDTYRLNATTPSAGLTTLEFYGHVAADVLGVPGQQPDDNSVDQFEINATLPGVTTRLFGQGGNDVFHNVNLGPFASGNFNLDAFAGPLHIDGGTGTNVLRLSDFNSSAPNPNVVVTSSGVSGLAGPAGGTPISYQGITGTFALEGSDTAADAIRIESIPAAAVRQISGNGGNDTLIGPDAASTWRITGTNSGSIDGLLTQFSSMENLRGGSAADTFLFSATAAVSGEVDGGGGTNTLDHSLSSTAVAVNLGLGASGLTASLEGAQEVPARTTAATGSATLAYDALTKQLSIDVAVEGLAPTEVTGFHIHRGAFGVNGPIIIDLPSLGALTPTASGFTFSGSVDLSSSAPGGMVNEAALLGGITYLNVHTPAFPGGEIRGQIFSTGNVNLPSGTATRTGGIRNIQNVVGSAAGDSLVGSFAANLLDGQGGNDWLVGGPGADTLLGGADDDILVWSNGDGSDLIEGGAGNDRVQVNGSLGGATIDDQFTIGASGSRVDFRRVSAGPFALDIGGVQTLAAIGIDGDDTFRVNSLAGVANLTELNLAGLDGDDTFEVTADAVVAINVQGFQPELPAQPGDTLTYLGSGSLTPTGVGSGIISAAGVRDVTYSSVETVGATGGLGLVISAALISQDDDGGPDDFLIRGVGDNFEIYINEVFVYGGVTADHTQITFSGSGDNDSLTVDHTDGLVAVPQIAFHGGGQTSVPGDRLEVRGGSFDQVISSYANAHDGSLNFDGLQITYTGLEPITLAVAMADLVFNLPAASNPDVELGDDAGSAAGMSELRGSTFENTTFANPSNSLTVNLGGSGDTITVAAMDAGFDPAAVGVDAAVVVNGGAAADTFQILAVSRAGGAAYAGLRANGGGGNDQFLISSQADLLGNLDSIANPLHLDGGTGTNDLRVSDFSSTTANANVVVTSTQISGLAGPADATTISYENITGEFSIQGSDNADDVILVLSTPAAALRQIAGQGGNDTLIGPDADTIWRITGTNAGSIEGLLESFTSVENLTGGSADDAFLFSDAAAVSGTVDGGGGTNTLDHSLSSTAVAVNLGLGTSGLTASLEGEQEVPARATAATGSAVLDYDALTKQLTIDVTVEGIAPADVTGFHIHRGAFGVNGPIIIDLPSLASLTPTGSGFTFSGSVNLSSSAPGGLVNEAALLGGVTYLNVHTPAFPGGEIRGQIFSTGNGSLPIGTATGTGGIRNIQNAIGGAAGDGLVGSFAANLLDGRGGNDVLVGGPGGDTLLGGAADDILVWSNGDGSDLIEGGSGNDRVQVNGSLGGATLHDEFTIGANGSRVDFRRVSAGPFALDIGGVQTLTAIGIDGDDTFRVNSLAGVADLTELNLVGLDGEDTFHVTPAATVAINVQGFQPEFPTLPGDVLEYLGTGTVTLSGIGGGTIAAAGLQDVTFSNIERVTGGPFHVNTPLELTLFNNKANPNLVTVASGGSQVSFDATSLLTLTPGNGVVNLVGDNNSANDQADSFVVVGTGPQEFTVELNGSAALQVLGTSWLNVTGGEDIDTLELTAWADNTPQGWGIQVVYDEGLPDGRDGEQDLLIYNTVAAHPVSENILVQPSGTEAGELRVTNAADGSTVVIVSYLHNLDIIVNDNDGFASDTDTLTLRGTNPDSGQPGAPSGNERVTADFTAAGGVADPLVTVADADSNVLLYRLRSMANFNTIGFQLLGGDDSLSVIGRDDGSLTVNVDGGPPAGSNTLVVPGTAAGSDLFAIVPGSAPDAGVVRVQRSTALTPTTINFGGIGTIAVEGAGGDADTLSLQGTGGNDVFTLSGTATLAGTARVNAGPQIAFSDLGAGSAIELDGGSGNDRFVVQHVSDWQIGSVAINGGAPASGDSFQLTATGQEDQFVYTPSAIDGGQIDLTSGGATTSYLLSSIASAAINGGAPVVPAAPGDSLTVTTAHAAVNPSTTLGAGTVAPTDLSGNPLLPLEYASIETVTVSGTTAVIQGTQEDDTITISADGVATVTNLFGFQNSIDVSGFDRIVINALGGNDSITIEAGSLFAAGIAVVGGTGRDRLAVNASPDVTVDFTNSTLDQIVAGAISFSDVQELAVTGSDGESNALSVIGYGSPTSVQSLILDGGDSDNDDDDTISISLTGGPDTLEFTPLGFSAAAIRRHQGGPEIQILGFNNNDNLAVDGAGSLDTVRFVGSASPDAISVVRDGAATRVELLANQAVKWVSLDLTSVEALTIDGGAGDDTLTVDNTGGLLDASEIVFHGGTGRDTLQLAGGTSVDSSVYSPGPAPGQGSVVQAAGGGSQSVTFAEVETVVDLVAADSLVVNATDAGDAISYSVSELDGAWGRVAVDALTAIHFDNKTDVTINALAGSDTVHLAATSAGFSGTLAVTGSDPAEESRLVVNGLAATVAVDVAAGEITGAGPNLVTFDGMGEVVVLAGASDRLEVDGSAAYTLNPGAATDEGTILTDSVPIRFHGFGAGATLGLTSVAAPNQLIVNGTAADDVFEIAAGGIITPAGRAAIETSGIMQLTVNGLDGDDVFNVAAGHGYSQVTLSGGNPSASDVANLTGDGSDITVDLDEPVTVSGGGLGTVLLPGVEIINVDAAAGDVAVTGTSGDDHLEYTPTAADAGTLVLAGLNAVLNLSGVATLSADAVDGSDRLTVHGTAGADTITIDGTEVAVNGRLAIAYTGVEALAVFGHQGSDTFRVTPSASLPIFVDGGDPVGGAGGDVLEVVTGGAAVTFNLGPENDEGSIVVDGLLPVSFDHIESLGSFTVPGGATINGTNGRDAITIIARDGSTHAGADGNQDFTVTVNDGFEILFLDTPSLAIDAGGGSDEIAIQLPAPNGVAWDVTLSIDGGLPAGTDRVVVNTLGTASVEYTPSGFDSGMLQVTNLTSTLALTGVEQLVYSGGAGDGDLTVVGTAEDDTIVHRPGAAPDQGTIQVNSFLPLEYVNLGGGATLSVDGSGGDDTLVVDGTAANDVFSVAGNAVALNNRLPITSSDVEQLVLRGLGGNDTFDIAGDHDWPAITVEGSGGSQDDVLTFSGSGPDVTLDLAARTISEVGSGPVTFSGAGIVNVMAGGRLRVLGTPGNDQLSFTPSTADAGTLLLAGLDTVFLLSGVTELEIDPLGGSDAVTVQGTSAGDTITVARGATTTVRVDPLLAVALSGATESLVISAGLGSDTIEVRGTGGPALLVDGGGPDGEDVLAIEFATGGGTTIVEPGATPDSGAVRNAADGPVNFRGIALLDLTAAEAGDTLIVLGTGGSDSIALLPDEPGSDANLALVNDRAIIRFRDFTTVTLEGRAGRDSFSVHPAALNGVDTISVRGGDPADNDSLVVNGSDGKDAIAYNPSDSASGAVIVNGLGVGFDGIESVTIDGQGGGDDLTVTTPGGAHQITLDAGSAIDSGRVEITGIATPVSNPPLVFRNLGADGSVTFADAGAADTLIYLGTAGDDQFGVDELGDVTLNDQLPVSTPGISQLILRGLDGDDTFTIAGNHPLDSVAVQGGSASASDVLEFVGSGAGEVTLDLAARALTQAGSGPVAFSGVEIVNITADAVLTILGTAGNDQLSYTPTGVEAGTLVLAGLNVTFNFSGVSELTLDPLGGTDTVTVHGTSAADEIEVVRGATTIVQVDGTLAIQLTAATEALVIAAGAGDDLIEVTGTGGPALTIEGGGPAPGDTLSVQADDVTVTFGDDASSGVLIINGDAISFTGISAIDLIGGGAGTLIIQGTDGDDAINQNGHTVTVNSSAAVTFVGYSTLELNGRSGSDSFNVHPTTLGGVTTFTVNGGDPTDSDSLVVNGFSDADEIEYSPRGPASGAVTINGSAVDFTGIESVTIDGQGGGDLLTVTTPDGVHRVTLTPGASIDAGRVEITGTGTAVSNPPLTFRNLGAGGSVTFADAGASDTLIYLGTAGDDQFGVDAAGVVTLNDQLPVNTPGVSQLILRGLDGDDTFSIAGDHSLDSIAVEGGSPSAGDVLEFVGSGTELVRLDLAARTVTQDGSGPVAYSGIARIDLDAGGVGPVVTATDGDDLVTVTVFDAGSGEIQLVSAAAAPLVHYTNTGGDPVHIDLGGGEDTLTVVGNALPQTFEVDGLAQTVSIDDNNDGGNDGIVTYANAEALAVHGLQGSDVFRVTGGPIPIFIDGGDPIGALPGDTLIVTNAFAFFPGPETDEGGFLTTGGSEGIVSFDHIESLVVAPPPDNDCPFIIFGTGGDDDITVIARDGSTHDGADGVRDFTVSINQQAEILFLNVPHLVIDALAGDDDIVIRTPAPNQAAWDVELTVIGGPSSGITGDQGDVLIVETPGEVDVQYTPGGSDTGAMVITGPAGPVATITIQSTRFIPPADCPPLPEPFLGGNGGIETLIFDGEGLTASLTVNGTAGSDTIVHTPGEAFDEGQLRVNNLLGIRYQNLGGDAELIVDGGAGEDTLVVQGTAASDGFVVDSTDAETGRIQLNARLPLLAAAVEDYTLQGLAGDDNFVISLPLAAGTTGISVDGGTGRDSLSVLGEADVADAFTVLPGAIPGLGAVAVTGSATATAGYRGVEQLFLFGSPDDADTLLVEDDARDNRWDVLAGSVGDLVQIEGRESLEFAGFADVTLVNTFGTDTFVVAPTNLTGFSGELTVLGNSTFVTGDVLHLLGTPGNDVVTATADTVTINGVPVTLGNNLFAELRISTLAGDDIIGDDGQGGNAPPLALALPGVRKVVDAGAGNDIVNMSLTQDAVIFGGDGDDLIVGTPLADLIDGGRGDDTIFGLGGDDVIYGGDGNDVLVGGAGTDRMFGGDGSDTFIWNPGDGSDIVEGGSNEADALVFNGAAADEIFHLFADPNHPARAILFRQVGAASLTIDMAGVELVTINTLGGADRVNAGRTPASLGSQLTDLSTTGIRAINVDLGGADGAADIVEFEGRALDDNLLVSTSSGVVQVAGLAYSLFVHNPAIGDGDRLDVRGNDGDDRLVVAAGTAAVLGVRLFGDAGDDVLIGDALLLDGGEGDDYLEGGPGDNVLQGGPGEDVLYGRGGNDTYDGGADFDTILVKGTSAADTIQVVQTTATTLVHTVQSAVGGAVDGGTQTDTFTAVERVRIEAGAGDDVIRVSIADALFNMPGASLLFDIDGGPAGTRDRLAVIDGGADDLTIYRRGADASSGSFTIGPANAEPFGFVFQNVEYAEVLDELNRAVTQANNNGRLVVFKHDPYEANNDILVATHLGAGTINIDPTIDPGEFSAGPPFDFVLPADEDWFRLQAAVTGTLDVQVFFEQIASIASSGRPGLPGNGNLDIELYDADGLVNGVPLAIAGTGAFGSNDATNNERIRIPAVQGQVYYLRVRGATPAAVNQYSLTVLSQPAPMPFDLELADNLTILTGGQEVPGVNTIANGTANFQYNAAANTFDIDMFVYGVELTDVTSLPELTMSHIHGPAGPGVNAAPIFTFNNAQWVQEGAGIRLRLTGQTFPAGQVAALLAGNTYLNVHTTTNPGGEIRGQINVVNVLGVSDTGRSQFDNVTRDNTPTIFLRLDDAILLNDVPGNAAGVPGAAPVDQLIPIPHVPSTAASPVNLAPGYRVAVFDETNMHSPVLLGFAQPVANLPGVYAFTFTTPLTDGSHFISARVQMIDPADNDQVAGTQTRATGFGPRSVSLEIVIDTVPPPVSFGNAGVAGDGVIPDSDTSVIPNPHTSTDLITSDRTPTFWGRAEANAIVRVYADVNGNGVLDPGIDAFLGQDTAIPIDGTNQEPNGFWRLESIVDLNDETLFPTADGVRTIFVTAEDLAGNVNFAPGAADTLRIFLDTTPPVIDAVFITSDPGYDLFDPKPSTDGPTPLVNSLTIVVTDLPERVAPDFLFDALKADVAAHPGHYRLIGDANGIIPIQSVTVIQTIGPDPDRGLENVATAQIVLTFFEPLPDDRFTLIVSDALVDLAGNRLDGESNAAEPQENPLFPTGDGIPGGDFVARFTVDSRPEIAVYHSGSVWVDTNGNFVFDPDNTDHTNRDIVYQWGFTTDNLFAGNFSPAGPASVADGFDKLAAYGRVGNSFRWLIDTDNDGVADVNLVEPLGLSGIPVAGNFDGNAANGDEVGLFSGNTWYFDTNHDFQLNAASALFTPNMSGLPIVGDFNGDGHDDLGTWRDDRFTFLFTNGTPRSWVPGTEVTYFFGFIGVRERPLAADMDMDGIDDIGLFVPDRAGVTPLEAAEWYFLISGGVPLPNRIAAEAGVADFKPVPFGNDLYAQFGDEFAVPLVGNFDPPVASTGSTPPPTAGHTNPHDPADVNGDGRVSPQDALILINDLNDLGTRVLGPPTGGPPYLDVNGDGSISPQDVLIVINRLNDLASQGEGESPALAAAADTGVPLVSVQYAAQTGAEPLVRPEAPAGDLHAAAVDRYFGKVRENPAEEVEELFPLGGPTDEQDAWAGLWDELLEEIVSGG